MVLEETVRTFFEFRGELYERVATDGPSADDCVLYPGICNCSLCDSDVGDIRELKINCRNCSGPFRHLRRISMG